MNTAIAVPRNAARFVRDQLRTTSDRLMYASRRRQAAERIRRGRPRSVLMVCHGNICRSPYAAVAFEQSLRSAGVKVDSAGFIGPDRPSPPEAQAAATSLQIDLSAHRSKLMTPELLREHDLIVVMEPAQRRTLLLDRQVPSSRVLVLGDVDPMDGFSRTIADPYGAPAETFVACYTRISRCVEALALLLRETLEKDQPA